jgi:hypothetical protein
MFTPSQTINFVPPSFASNIQGQIGTVQGQVTTSKVVSTARAIYADGYTFPTGLGPYHADIIPLQVQDKFSQPLFYANTETEPLFTSTGAVDVVGNYDMVIGVPSQRTTPVYDLVYTGAFNTCSSLSAFNVPLEDYFLVAAGNYNPDYVGKQVMGPELRDKCQAFADLCFSGSTTTGARHAALATIQADPQYQSIRANLKVPAKIFNNVVSGSDFVYDNLLALDNLTPLVNTGSDGITAYNTKLSRSSYSATGNMLLPSKNQNAINNKMGLHIQFMGDGCNPDNIGLCAWTASSIASLGYVSVILPCIPWDELYQRLDTSTKSLSKICAEKLLPSALVTNVMMNPNSYVHYPYSTLFSTASPALYRLTVQPQDPAAQLVMERYFYQIKCVLNQLGLAPSIDFNNVIVSGISRGGVPLTHAHRICTNGLAQVYNDPTNPAQKAFLWKSKAMINMQCVFYDFTIKRTFGNNNLFNNKFRIGGVSPLKIPMITITGDADVDLANISQFTMGYNLQAQVQYQLTAQSMVTSNTPPATVSRNAMKNSFVMYVPATAHVGFPTFATGANDDGEQTWGASIAPGFSLNWGNPWKIDQYCEFPLKSDVIQSGLLDEYSYNQLESYRRLCAYQLIVHRFLGSEYPVPDVALNTLGYRIDQAPQAVDYNLYFQSLRVGECEFNYDVYSNVMINRGFMATGPSGFITSKTGTFTSGISTNSINVTQAALPATDTTIAYKIPVVVNGTTYYISLTAAQ